MAHDSTPTGREDLRKGNDRRLGRNRRKINLGPPTPPGIERRKSDRRSGRERRRDG